VGVLIVTQLRVQRRLRVVTFDRDAQAILLSELVDANVSLRAEVESLRVQQTTYEGENRGAVLEELVAELNRVRVINGMVEVSGPGVELVIDGPLNALDLQDLINELRNAGAEAIALNDHRLVVKSVLTVDVQGGMAVDGQPISRPYRFQAIGDSDTIETALLRPGGVISLFRRTYPNLVVQSTQHPRLVLAVYRPQVALQYAQPVE
jgi:uncharacterized protein YlxW (UPF0749 family)